MINSQNEPNRKRNHLLTSLIFTLAVVGFCCYLFSNIGPFHQTLHIDLSFLLLPFIGYYIIRLASRLCGGLIDSDTGTIAAYILNGIAFSFFSYAVLSRAVLLTHIPALAGYYNTLADCNRIAFYPALLFAGYTIIKISFLAQPVTLERFISPALAALGQVLIGFSFWWIFAAFQDYWAPLNGIGLVLFGAMLALAASTLATYAVTSSSSLAKDIGLWLRKSPAWKFIGGALIAVYFVFIRPAIFSHFSYAFLIEWLLVCFIAWRILSAINGFLQFRHSVPIIEAEWEKHHQQINDIGDEDFTKVVIFQERFIETGYRRDLVYYLKALLINNGLNEDEVTDKLQGILEYNDRKVPWYAFWLWRTRIQRQNRSNRQLVLSNIIDELGLILSPARRKV